MRTLHLIFAATLTATLAFAACGPTEEESEGSADAFYSTRLNSAKQSECNGRSKFYDNYEDTGACDTRAIATWECSRAGLATRLDGVVGAAASLASIDERISAGMEFHQCGETDGDIAIILIDKGLVGNTASISVERSLLVISGGTIAVDRMAADNLAKAKTAMIFGKALRGTDALFALECNSYQFKFLVSAASPTCAAVAVSYDSQLEDGGWVDVWTIESADGSVLISGVETDEKISIGGTPYNCFEYSDNLYTAAGDAVYAGSTTILSSKVAKGIADVEGAFVYGIGFPDSASCKAFTGE